MKKDLDLHLDDTTGNDHYVGKSRNRFRFLAKRFYVANFYFWILCFIPKLEIQLGTSTFI